MSARGERLRERVETNGHAAEVDVAKRFRWGEAGARSFVRGLVVGRGAVNAGVREAEARLQELS